MIKVQFVWWKERPALKWWKYPHAGSTFYKHYNQPFFYGLYLGVVELRFWLNQELRHTKRLGDKT